MQRIIRQPSFDEFLLNPNHKKHHQMDLLFSLDPASEEIDLTEYSPPSPVESSASSASMVEEELDSIFDEVLSGASPIGSPCLSHDMSHDNVTLPDIDAIQPTLNSIYEDVIEPKVEPQPENQHNNTDEIDYMVVDPVAAPFKPKARTRTAATSLDERKQRKRNSNMMSSRKYRQKIKNKESDLLTTLNELNQKKRTIELDLAKTKAVNSFLVEQLRGKFGSLIYF